MTSPTHNHGGQLKQASKKYDIPLQEWVDLSTGISPVCYPLPNVPSECWQRLPESNDGLEQAASAYYGSDALFAVSGSQEAIQRLPYLFPKNQKVGILTPAYHSHQQAWERAGHSLIPLLSTDIEETIPTLDVLIIVNPCNPSCETFSRETLLDWHQQLRAHNGTLIVDEAFMDATPDNSLIEKLPKKRLIVLRSIGKFFGLAGIRLGFVWADETILQALADKQDDWSVSHPARWAGKIALQDFQWQQQQCERLKKDSLRLKALLNCTKWLKTGGVCFNKTRRDGLHSSDSVSTNLFHYIKLDNAAHIYQQLARQGILTRLFSNPSDSSALRFGLPSNKSEWQRLEQALKVITDE